MIRVNQVQLPLGAIDREAPVASETGRPPEEESGTLRKAVAKKLGVQHGDLAKLRVVRRTADARKRSAIKLVYSIDLELHVRGDSKRRTARALRQPIHTVLPSRRLTPATARLPSSQRQRDSDRSWWAWGRAVSFAGLILAEMGFRPLILERGKEVRKRTVDTFALWRKRQLDPESNVQFGEGGAGTFSDGKLYSQVRDRKHHGRKVLNENSF